MRAIEKEWKSLQDAYDKTPEKIPGAPGKDKYGQLEKMIDRLLRKRLSDRELRQLAGSTEAVPGREFISRTVEFMVRAFVDVGDRRSLVNLLSRRCPGRVGWYDDIEFYLAFRGKTFTCPILILGEAYSSCQIPATRHALAAAVRRGFAGLDISGKDDADYVTNAMEWYKKRKDHLVVNPNYWRNEMHVPLESYEMNPKLYDTFPPPYKREPLFEEIPVSHETRNRTHESGQVGSTPVAGAGIASSQHTNDETVETELTKLQGTWQVVTIVNSGETVAEDKIKSGAGRGQTYTFHFSLVLLSPRASDSTVCNTSGRPCNRWWMAPTAAAPIP